MSQPRVLVTGATGFLGPFAVAELARVADVVTLARGGGDLQCDLADAAALAAAVAASGADLVLHLAARSRIADCDRDPAAATATNAIAAGQLAELFGVRLLSVSTDLVFDGHGAPYSELDPVAPLSSYGQSKACGEEHVLAAGGRVVRLPLLFGADPEHRGATGMIRAALANNRSITLYTNEYRTPLHARDAARGLVELLFADDRSGISHLAGPERVSRWELGLRFCALHGLPREPLIAAECQDGARPRDVSLQSGWQPPRSLDAMLRSS